MPANILKLTNVSLTRGKKSVLKNIDWEIRQGQHWFMMGPNGAGKSSLLEILSGYLWPSKGDVEVLGQKFGKTYLPELRRKMGFVSPWLLKRIDPATPVIEVIASGLTASTFYDKKLTSSQKEKMIFLLAFLSCEEVKHKNFGELSSGEQLKVIIARALLNEPPLLILDEPFSHLDFGTRQHLYSLLEHLAHNQKKLSIVLTTHHLEDVREFFTHGLLLKDGSFVYTGEKLEVLAPGLLEKAFVIKVS